jgi:hypothetical protein
MAIDSQYLLDACRIQLGRGNCRLATWRFVNKFVFGIVFLGVSRWRPQIVIHLVEVAHGI